MTTDEGIASILDLEDNDRYKAPWDWFYLPIDDGDLKLDRISSGDTLIIEQHAGRKLKLASFYQYPTYSGLLCGMPQARNEYVEWALKTARKIFGDEGDKLHAILRPRLIRLPPWDNAWEEFPEARLPLVTSIGEFNSTPASNHAAFRSSAIAIWFQEHFGIPTDDHILTQLRNLEWAAHAWDWTP